MPRRDSRTRTLLLATSGNFAQLGARMLISPLVPAIMVSFAVSKSRIGLVLTGMWAVYALFQYPGGTLGDRFDERRVLFVSLGLTAAVPVLLGYAPTFALFGLFVLLLGAGTGLYFPVASSMLTKRFEHTGQALSLLTAGGSIAGLIYPAAAGFLVVAVGWRPTMAAAGLVAFLVLLGGIAFTGSPDGGNGDRSREWLSLAAMRAIFRRPGVPLTVALSVGFGFTWQGIASFFPTFLFEYWSLSETAAGVAFGGLYLLSSIAQPVVGRLSDAVDRDLAMVTSATLAASGLGVLLFAPRVEFVVVGVIVLGLGISWPGVVQARIMDHFGDAERGQGFGFIRTVYMLLGSLGSVVVGSLADAFGWIVAYGALVGVLSVVLVVLVTRRLSGQA